MRIFRQLKKIFIKPRFANTEIMHNVFIDEKSYVGEYSYIGSNTSVTKAQIGRYCSIGTDVVIGPGEHILDAISTSAHFYENPYEILTQGEISIGNDVWVGTKAVIMRGVTVGDGAVIGAGAIVTKDVEAYSIVVGVPAQKLRKRFSENQIQQIQDSKWWNLSPLEAKKIHHNLLEDFSAEKN